MDYQVVVLFIVAALNAIFSYLTLKGDRNITNILFSLFTLSLSLWALNIAFFINTNNLNDALIFANFYYVAAAAIPLLFFYFSLFFLDYKKLSKIYFLYTIPFFIILLLFILDKNILVEYIDPNSISKSVILNKVNYLYYIIYFISYLFLAYYNLFRSYFTVKSTQDKIKKIQLKFIIIGTIFPYFLGMIFNLFLPAFNNYQNIWLGPPFTLIMVASMGYAIAKYNLFNTKVIVAEVLTFTIWISVVVKILTANNLMIQIIDVILLLAITFFGLLLIRGVRKEVEIRERVERLAGEISMANKKLRNMERQKTEFVSIASHQLRTPLTAIKGYASMLLEGSFGKLTEEIKEAVDKIFKSSQILVVIIEEFLIVSRIEQGRMKYDFSTVDFRGLVEEVVKNIKPNAEEKKLKIDMYIEDYGNFNARADKTKIKQVIYNVVNNAIKYTNSGFIKILLSKNKENGKIRIAVSDTGMGINRDMMLRLFNKFSKGKKSKLGSGIGLYVAKEIIKAHKGKIWAKSEGDGEGATFFIEIAGVEKGLKNKK